MEGTQGYLAFSIESMSEFLGEGRHFGFGNPFCFSTPKKVGNHVAIQVLQVLGHQLPHQPGGTINRLGHIGADSIDDAYLPLPGVCDRHDKLACALISIQR